MTPGSFGNETCVRPDYGGIQIIASVPELRRRERLQLSAVLTLMWIRPLPSWSGRGTIALIRPRR